MEPPVISEPWYLIHKRYPENEEGIMLNNIDEMKLDTRIMDVLYDFGKDLWINIRSSPQPPHRPFAFGKYPDDIYFHVRRTGSNDFIRAFEIISVWVRTAPWMRDLANEMPMKNESGWKVIHYDKNNPWNPKSIPEDQQVVNRPRSNMWQPLTSEGSTIWKETLRNIWIPLSWLDISSFLYREYIRIEMGAVLDPAKTVEIRILPYHNETFQAAINKRSI